jgi:hypothetical protein
MNAAPLLALKKGLRAFLLAKPSIQSALGTAIYNNPPRGTEPAYLLLGDASGRENGTNDAPATIADLDLIVFTRERGTEDALRLAGLVEAALADAAVPVPGHHASLLLIREVVTRTDAARNLARVTLKLRAFLHPL